MICFPLGNTSLFNTFHSIDILPGPVNKRLVDIAVARELINIANCLSSGPPAPHLNINKNKKKKAVELSEACL
jgi:hypothetical protein